MVFDAVMTSQEVWSIVFR